MEKCSNTESSKSNRVDKIFYVWGGEVTIDTTRENAFFVSVIVVGLSKLCFTSVDYFCVTDTAQSVLNG